MRLYFVLALTAATAITGCAPQADFTAAPTSGTAPLEVAFENRSESVILGVNFEDYFPAESFAWDFGDGRQSTEENPSHTYTEPGTYSVSLSASNRFGTGSSRQENLINVGSEQPSANFTAAPTSGEAPLEVSFSDTSTPGSSPIRRWAWTFGDGGTSDDPSPDHTYTAAGTYTVALTITTDDGASTRTQEALITVTAPAEGEGDDEGAAEGSAEGEPEGSPEGVVEGEGEGTTEGSPEGVVEGEGEGLSNPLATITRTIDAAGYVPGCPYTVTVTIDIQEAEAVSALGFYERIPAEWGFNGVSGGTTPAVAQRRLDGTVEFAWITTPAFPFSFSYRIVPVADTVDQTIDGQLEYRTTGNAIFSDVFSTTLAPSCTADCPACP